MAVGVLGPGEGVGVDKPVTATFVVRVVQPVLLQARAETAWKPDEPKVTV